ncbi:MAG: glutathione S-transferase [Rhizobacter sp.]
MTYQLHDGPAGQGSGEFLRLALEAAGAPYVDVGRGTQTSLHSLAQDSRQPHPPFATPFLQDGNLVMGQTAAILHHLAPTLKLVARSEQARVWTQQIQLTIEDMLLETEAARAPEASADFGHKRMPQCLQWFETIITRNPAGPRHLVAGKLSYADLSLLQLIEVWRQQFPGATDAALAQTPMVAALLRRVAALPKVAAYWRSERRVRLGAPGAERGGV